MHISGGGEPFLHRQLDALIEESMLFEKQFSKFIIFTNGTIIPPENMLKTLAKHNDILTVRISDYGIFPDKTDKVITLFEKHHVKYRAIRYHGTDQEYGGWVDYGAIKPHHRSPDKLREIFKNCASYRDLAGNWRCRNGEVYFCSRAARGAQLGLIPKNPNDYVDLFDNSSTREEKRQKFTTILNSDFITACDYCNGDYGTDDSRKRYPAAEQL